MELTAPVHSVESFATLDGTGIRYALFFQGCPLRCDYCHNPDTQPFAGGNRISTDDAVKKILRYKTYFNDGGGVTFSGGEPLLHAAFIAEAERKLADKGIGCAIDTSGAVALTDDVKAAIDGAQMIILDIKMPCEEMYRKYIHGSSKTVYEIFDYALSAGKRIWLRTVIVPGINDTRAAVDEYLAAIGDRIKRVEKYELLPFHTLGFSKYEKLGWDNPMKDTPAMSREKTEELQSYLDSRIKQ